MNQTHYSDLIEFRRELHQCYPRRKDAIINLLDALTSYGHRAKSVIQLSRSNYFERQYSSITDAIADGLPYADERLLTQLRKKVFAPQGRQQVHRFLLDVTPNERLHASTLEDRSIVHAANATPGNKPIAVGHQYSVLVKLPEDEVSLQKHWVIPVSARRVESSEKGHEMGMQQLKHTLQELAYEQQLCVSVGDSLYSSEQCRQTASDLDNLVHICRLNSKRCVFATPEPHSTGRRGRPKSYGDAMRLGEPDTHLPCNETIEHPWYTVKKPATMILKVWHNMLLKGSNQFASADYPMTLIQIRCVDDDGQPVYKRPLWIGIFGKRRQELSPWYCAKSYFSRYDIEHFFRFGKNKLLLDAFQTPDVIHEQCWWQLCLLAYWQLYLARKAVIQCPEPWERYLPEFKKQDADSLATPSQTQRAFYKILNEIGTPASTPKPRGNPKGRQFGETQLPRPKRDIIFKGKKKTPLSKKNISPASEKTALNSNPDKINRLLSYVNTSLSNLNISAQEFIKLMQDTS